MRWRFPVSSQSLGYGSDKANLITTRKIKHKNPKTKPNKATLTMVQSSLTLLTKNTAHELALGPTPLYVTQGYQASRTTELGSL